MEVYNKNITSFMEKGAFCLDGMVMLMNETDSEYSGVPVNNELRFSTTDCCPTNMVGGGKHFNDSPKQRPLVAE
jgi:hypothetical protein